MNTCGGTEHGPYCADASDCSDNLPCELALAHTQIMTQDVWSNGGLRGSPEMNDPRKAQVCEKVYMDVEIGEEKEGRLVIGLFSDMLPRTCENFRSLCEGFKTSDGKTISYRDTPFHRVIRGFMAQGGDVTEGNGTGTQSISRGRFHFPESQVDPRVKDLLRARNLMFPVSLS